MTVLIVILVVILVTLISYFSGLYMGWKLTRTVCDKELDDNIKLKCFIHKNRVYGIKDITPKTKENTKFKEAINYGKN